MAHDTDQYKEQLEALKAALTEELQAIGIQNPDNKSDWIEKGTDLNTPSADPNEVADRTEEWDERRATVAVLENRYNNIQRALVKIAEGTFGTCEICGAEISEARLAANPAARTCEEHMNEEAQLPA